MLREHRARVHNTGAKTARSAAAEPGEGPNSRAVRPQEKKAAVGGIAPRAFETCTKEKTNCAFANNRHLLRGVKCGTLLRPR